MAKPKQALQPEPISQPQNVNRLSSDEELEIRAKADLAVIAATLVRLIHRHGFQLVESAGYWWKPNSRWHVILDGEDGWLLYEKQATPDTQNIRSGRGIIKLEEVLHTERL